MSITNVISLEKANKAAEKALSLAAQMDAAFETTDPEISRSHMRLAITACIMDAVKHGYEAGKKWAGDA